MRPAAQQLPIRVRRWRRVITLVRLKIWAQHAAGVVGWWAHFSRRPRAPITDGENGGDAEAEWEAGEVGEVVEAEVVDWLFQLLD